MTQDFSRCRGKTYNMATMQDIQTYEEGTSYHIIINNVDSDQKREQIQSIIAAYLGAYNEYTEYFDDTMYDEDYSYDDSIGSLNVIPDGIYKGYTIQDVYNINGHSSLVNLLMQIKKMKTASEEQKEDLYKEAIMFAIPVIRRKEVNLEEFVAAYKPFLSRKIEGVNGETEDWLSLPEDKQDEIYDKIIENIVNRMEKSIAA